MSTTSTRSPPKRIIRFHAKSRTGCVTCKKRRKKCDEVEPRCNNCRWRGLNCVWAKARDKQQGLTLYKPLSAPRPIPIDVASLRMIHHFGIATSASFCSDPRSVAMSSVAVPQLSWHNPHLLHAMLSFTALHLGRLYPTEPNWVHLASTHRRAAIDALPGAINLDSKFLTVGLFTMYTFSSSLASSPENIFSLMISFHNVWSPLEGHHRYRSPSFKILDPFVISSKVDSEMNTLGHLQRIYDFSMPSFESESEDLFNPDIRAAYKEAVEALYAAYPLSRMGYEAKSAVLWPAIFGRRFLTLLNERRQRALVLLYYYLMMMRDMNEQNLKTSLRKHFKTSHACLLGEEGSFVGCTTIGIGRGTLEKDSPILDFVKNIGLVQRDI
uniref:Zn(2)-C6 fungal-type domain-containing protein n=1 Tax=Moniliophthora roreri TaxID=221103 RepID=A0A0W0FFA1_MONRR